MAMTNNQIIMQEKMLLGITEEIHTFQIWKSMGYCVKKGEKACAKFPIWKYGGKKTKDENGEEVVANPHCFLKESAFFKKSQVEPLGARA